MLSSTLPNWVIAKQQSPTQKALIMDAMGEIRLTHTRELIKEVIDSGTNAVTVTLCDPKYQEQEAYEIALAELLAYDRHIQKNSDLFIKATKVADVDKAKKEGALVENVKNEKPPCKITPFVTREERYGTFSGY